MSTRKTAPKKRTWLGWAVADADGKLWWETVAVTQRDIWHNYPAPELVRCGAKVIPIAVTYEPPTHLKPAPSGKRRVVSRSPKENR